MTLLGTVEMGIEGGRDAADQETGIALHRKRGAVERDDAVGRQLLQARRGIDQGLRRQAVPFADRREIGGKIAHDALDDLGAQPVVIGQRVALGRCEPAGGDRNRF